MDFLILLMIVSALMNSVNKSNEAKKKHAEKQSRQTPMMQPQQKKTADILLPHSLLSFVQFLIMPVQNVPA